MKRSTIITGLLCSLGSIALAHPAQAMNFEGGTLSSDNWTSTGDAIVTGNSFNGIGPFGSGHAVITTAKQGGADDGLSSGSYNNSGTDAVSAITGDRVLQNFLGLPANGLDVGIQTPTEGSAIRKSITLDSPGNLSFNYAFLSNDGNGSFLGPERDYGFFLLTDSSNNVITLELLGRSSGAFPSSLTPPDYDKNVSNGYQVFNYGNLAAGDYNIAFGAVDIDGDDKTSALLVDNVEIPTPALLPGVLAFMGGLIRKKKRQIHATAA